MAAPWAGVAQLRIIGELHGQETVNVMHFATNETITDTDAVATLLLQLANAMLECVIESLLPAVTADWKAVRVDAKLIYPTVSDPVVATADAGSVGELGATEVSFASSLVNIRTGGGGRRGRGRIFLPPAGEANITASSLDSGTLTLITAFCLCVAGKFMGSGATTDWLLGVLSHKTLTGTGGTYNNAFRIATNLNPVADVAVMRSRRKGHGA